MLKTFLKSNPKPSTMAKTLQITLASFLLYASFLLQQTLAAKIIVTNNSTTTPGGIRFDREIGAAFTIATEQSINQFIWNLFRQSTPADRKDVPVLNVVVKRLDDDTLAETGGDNIYVNDNGIMSFGDAKFDFTALMYHETTHIFQWSGRGTAPGGLTEGIADYVVMKSKYFVSEGYTKPGEGRWDEGYGVTARFLEYCDGLREGFTVDLNNKMREVYKDEYFLEMLGKPLDQVWNEYKAKYAK